MKPVIEVGGARVFLGDCRDVLRGLPDNSVDAVVTDPPYELGFMGKRWDSTGVAYDVTVWAECLRVLKPGGHILAFGGSRTFHRLGVAIEDAGFEIRDTIAWISSKTFPKSLNVEKAMNKAGMDGSVASGWGTGLKQVVEPVVLGRKPVEGTVAENFERWGVGGLNIDGSRIPSLDGVPTFYEKNQDSVGIYGNGLHGSKATGERDYVTGRWPANVILDEVTAGLLDEQSGVSRDGVAVRRNGNSGAGMFPVKIADDSPDVGFGGRGGASRFFYVAKASKRDRNEGLDHITPQKKYKSGGVGGTGGAKDATQVANQKPMSNFHPTVKPTQLMRYLIKLVTPPGGTVLDPFTGSGSTGKAALLDGFGFVGVELTEEYLPIIEGRLRWASEQTEDDTLF